MKTSLTPLITEAERCLAEAIKHFKLVVKPEQILVTVQSKGRKNAVGWFWAERWSEKKAGAAKSGKGAAFHEINISAECITTHHMGELMLHELAHAENNAKDIKDCSNRVHNKHFKTMAETLGLEVKPRDKSVGYGYTDLGPGAKDFLAKIKFDQELFTKARVNAASKTAGAGSRMLKVECPACEYVARITRKWLDIGVPTCPCGKKMEEA